MPKCDFNEKTEQTKQGMYLDETNEKPGNYCK